VQLILLLQRYHPACCACVFFGTILLCASPQAATAELLEDAVMVVALLGPSRRLQPKQQCFGEPVKCGLLPNKTQILQQNLHVLI